MFQKAEDVNFNMIVNVKLVVKVLIQTKIGMVIKYKKVHKKLFQGIATCYVANETMYSVKKALLFWCQWYSWVYGR